MIGSGFPNELVIAVVAKNLIAADAAQDAVISGAPLDQVVALVPEDQRVDLQLAVDGDLIVSRLAANHNAAEGGHVADLRGAVDGNKNSAGVRSNRDHVVASGAVDD